MFLLSCGRQMGTSNQSLDQHGTLPSFPFSALPLTQVHAGPSVCGPKSAIYPAKAEGNVSISLCLPPDPFENILLIASLMLECFFTNLLLMHVKLTPTVIGAAQRKSPTRARGSVSHEGP